MAIRLARVALKGRRFEAFAPEEYERRMLAEPAVPWNVTPKGNLLVSIEEAFSLAPGDHQEYTAIGFIEKPLEDERPEVTVRVALFDPRGDRMLVLDSNLDIERKRLSVLREFDDD